MNKLDKLSKYINKNNTNLLFYSSAERILEFESAVP